VLSCLTNDGKVHFFPVLKLLNPQTYSPREKCKNDYGPAKGRSEDLLENAFADLLLGEALHSKLNDTLLPLSSPLATVDLSFVSGTQTTDERDNVGGIEKVLEVFKINLSHDDKNLESKHDRAEQISKASVATHVDNDGSSNKDMDKGMDIEDSTSSFIGNSKPFTQVSHSEVEDVTETYQPFFDLSVLDASIEQSTAHNYTTNNIATICSVAFDSYVAIGGKGLRKVRKRTRRQRKSEDNSQGLKKDLDKTNYNLKSTDFTVSKTENSERDHDSNQNIKNGPEHEHSDLEFASSSRDTKPFVIYNEESHAKNKDIKSGHALPTKDADGCDVKESNNNRDFNESNGNPEHIGEYPINTQIESNVKENHQWSNKQIPGGFVTLISINFFAEVRTIFLPFVPKSIFPATWESMHLLIIMGTNVNECVALRTGCTNHTLPENSNKITKPWAPKFVPIPISIPCSKNSQVQLQFPLSGMAIPTSPPSIILCHSTPTSICLKLHSLTLMKETPVRAFSQKISMGSNTTIVTSNKATHFVSIIKKSPQNQQHIRQIWCMGGQGWTMLGLKYESLCDLFFISWEGSSSVYGSYSQHFQTIKHSDEINGISRFFFNFSSVLPLEQNNSEPGNKNPSITHPRGRNENSSISVLHSFTTRLNVLFESEKDGKLHGDDIDYKVMNVVNEISNIRKNRSSSLPNILLRHCFDWVLEGAKENKALIDDQVAVINICFGPLKIHRYFLTLRKHVVANEMACHFQVILSWLCQHKEYYSAAIIALNLLQDMDTIQDLRECLVFSYEHHEHQLASSHIDGLLDGILPLECYNIFNNVAEAESIEQSQKTLMALSNMAVLCLVKGGTSISQALECFLRRNRFYNGSWTCVLLVASTTRAISALSDIDVANIAQHSFDPLRAETHALWPIQCLLHVAVTRQCMPKALLFLNSSIPNEMRQQSSEESTTYFDLLRPPIELCKSIISMILASSENSSKILLNLVDDSTQKFYWQSLQLDTRLALSLLSVRGKYPLLREREVREWALSELQLNIHAERNSSPKKEGTLPSEWLQEVCVGSLTNAGCNLSRTNLQSRSQTENHTDQVFIDLKEEEELMYKMIPIPGSGGIDFDLLIPSLLLLQKKEVLWMIDTPICTKAILNVVCNMAGRQAAEEPYYAFDGVKVMKQCGMLENVLAVSHLIGGHNGLVLRCVHIILSVGDMDLSEAENFLLHYVVRGNIITKLCNHNSHEDFLLTDNHRHLLWLLEKHVLSIWKYGNFSRNTRGSIDPVFAAQICLRAWVWLSKTCYPHSGKWLSDWLRSRLLKHTTKKRLASAALTQAILWRDSAFELHETENEIVLADFLGFDNQFIVFLAQTSYGLVECVPLPIANEIVDDIRE